jgi:isochorismate pyruvate lyase
MLRAAAASPGVQGQLRSAAYDEAGPKSQGAAHCLDRLGSGDYAGSMSDTIKSPDDCMTMTDVRAGVDALDRDLIALLQTRFGYMRAAARIKPDRAHVRDEARKAEVIANAKAAAFEAGVPVGLVADFWERLVEASIAYETEHWDLLRR